MKRRALLFVLVCILNLPWWALEAAAVTRFEAVPELTYEPALDLDWSNQPLVLPKVKAKPKMAKRIEAAPTRHVIGKCYTEPGTPPANILRRESRGDPRIWNGGAHRKLPGHSSASGCWQFVRKTWARFKGYENAADAPVSVQNQRAIQVYDGGRGACYWSFGGC